MQFQNSKAGYGLVSIFMHWLMAILVIGLFFLGEYMVDLDYYSKWYVVAPWWHKGLGMLVFFLLIFRIGWMMKNVHPAPLPSYKRWEIILSKITHHSFYLLMALICISGYFITTAKGAGIDMFGLFEIPAMMKLETDAAEFFGEMHEITALIIMALVVLHVAATIKHHFIDKDVTFLRILKPVKQTQLKKEK